ncbi:TPA: hypothetical protein ACKUJ9_000076 [Neisseria gonorrhoeae]
MTEEMMKKQENFWDKLGDLLFAPVDIMFWIKKVWAAYPVCLLPVIVLKVNATHTAVSSSSHNVYYAIYTQV